MAFLIGGANSASGGYEIDNSLRVDDGDDVDLTFTPDSDGNKKVMTMSCWVKRGNLDGQHALMGARGDSTGISKLIRFQGTTNTITINHVIGNADKIEHVTNRKFRDISAWYHIVLALDTREAASTDGLKLYINGVRETSFATSTYTQNTELWFNNDTIDMLVGTNGDADQPFDGYIAEFHWIDGTMKAASDFGETNGDGIWIPKQYSGSYGDNGFYLEFKGTGTSQNSSGIGADTSGNDNHFAVTNIVATDVTTDTPTNNFATLNPLNNFQGGVLSQGNTSLVTPSSSTTPANLNGIVPATIGVANGKWYWEVNVTTTNYVAVGIMPSSSSHITYLTPSGSGTRIVKGDDGIKFSSNSSGGDYMAAYEGSILQVALDMDNGKITFGAGGSWANGSGATNQTFGNATAAYTDIISSGDYAGEFALPTFSDENQGTSDTFQVNFGNPLFAISSSNADANGYGNFEYAVPSGYFALCSKNLAEYG